MKLGEGGAFACPYCGSRFYLADKDLRNHQEFRKKLLAYYKAKNDEKELSYESDTLFEKAGTASFEALSGQKIVIEYMEKYAYERMDMYIARESLIYIFKDTFDADRFLNSIRQMAFPEADSKLYRSFPELKTSIDLLKGKALVFLRRPHFYPLEFFKPMEARHVAWVVSRMENICCALEYSGLQHGDINERSLFINVKTHEGTLFGDWTKVDRMTTDKDLIDIRKTAETVVEPGDGPKEFYEFLASKPKGNSYDDFSCWDSVIEKGFGGHNFIKYQ